MNAIPLLCATTPAAERVGGAGPRASDVPVPSRSEEASAEAEFGGANPSRLEQETPGPGAGASRSGTRRPKPHDLKDLNKTISHVHGGACQKEIAGRIV